MSKTNDINEELAHITRNAKMPAQTNRICRMWIALLVRMACQVIEVKLT